MAKLAGSGQKNAGQSDRFLGQRGDEGDVFNVLVKDRSLSQIPPGERMAIPDRTMTDGELPVALETLQAIRPVLRRYGIRVGDSGRKWAIPFESRRAGHARLTV